MLAGQKGVEGIWVRVSREEELRRQRRAERPRREHARNRRQVVLLCLGVFLMVAASIACMLAPAPTAMARVLPGIRGDISFEPVFAMRKALAAERRRAAQEAATPKPLVPAPGVRTIVADKGDQTVTLCLASGRPLDRFPCASGISYPRVGEYEVYGKTPQSWSFYDDMTTWARAWSCSPSGRSAFTHSGRGRSLRRSLRSRTRSRRPPAGSPPRPRPPHAVEPARARCPC